MWQRTRWRRFLWLLGRYRPLIFLGFGAGLVVAAPAMKSWTSSAIDPAPRVSGWSVLIQQRPKELH